MVRAGCTSRFYTGLDYGYAWSTNAGLRRDHAASTRAGVSFDGASFSNSLELAYPLDRPHYSETETGVAVFFDVAWSR